MISNYLYTVLSLWNWVCNALGTQIVQVKIVIFFSSENFLSKQKEE